MDAVERLGKKLEVKGHYISKANCQAMNFSKTNQWIHFYYYAICFRAFFGRNWRLQKGISKLSDLYFMLFSFHFFIEGLFLICEYLNRKFIFIWSSIFLKEFTSFNLEFCQFMFQVLQVNSYDIDIKFGHFFIRWHCDF